MVVVIHKSYNENQFNNIYNRNLNRSPVFALTETWASDFVSDSQFHDL